MKEGPVSACETCPRYRRYYLKIETLFTVHSFCSVCIHNNSTDLEVFCTTNRLFQEGSGEDFDCYRFRLRIPPKT